jgi:hypothetical protein
MTTLRMPANTRGSRTGPEAKPRPVVPHDEPNAKLWDGELFDLYAAILIVVPVALFLKSLFF